MLGCAKYVGATGPRSFCRRCKVRHQIHRKPLRVLDGGKNEEGTMTATSEATETFASEHRKAATIIGEALLLAESALVYVTISDAEKWTAAKELAGDRVTLRLIAMGSMGERVCESFDLYRGELTLRAHGPSRPATYADYARIHAQRENE